jgi:hypothetical protein
LVLLISIALQFSRKLDRDKRLSVFMGLALVVFFNLMMTLDFLLAAGY